MSASHATELEAVARRLDSEANVAARTGQADALRGLARRVRVVADEITNPQKESR